MGFLVGLIWTLGVLFGVPLGPGVLLWGPLFVNCQNLRWVPVDETSSASAEILGILDANLRSAIRKEGTYAMRRRGKATERRPFGGLNMLFFTG